MDKGELIQLRGWIKRKHPNAVVRAAAGVLKELLDDLKAGSARLVTCKTALRVAQDEVRRVRTALDLAKKEGREHTPTALDPSVA